MACIWPQASPGKDIQGVPRPEICGEDGTTTLFAALNVLDDAVIGHCQQRHTHVEWLKFLRQINRETAKDKELHLICNNYATHKHPKVREWLEKHPRFHMHFTPTSASWLNMVERFFRDLTSQRLRRGVFVSVPELVSAIDEYIEKHNQNPKPFIWTAKANDILEKVVRANCRLSCKKNDALHQEPDLCALNINDNPILVSEKKSMPLASLTVVEIKRPMRNDASEGEDKNPIEQALGYLKRIREGKVKTTSGRPIRNSQEIPGYVYVISDLTPTMVERCELASLTETYDGMGFFGYNKPQNAYIEVISYDRLLQSAKERNRAFFDQLGLPA